VRKEIIEEAQKIRSSYKDSDYGLFFYSLTKLIKPEIVVEFGVLDGYSTIHIAEALRFLRCHNSTQHFFAYDLWEDYPYKHGNLEEVQSRISKLGLSDCVFLMNGDIFSASKHHNDNTIQLFHVDISNNGNIVREVMNIWNQKIAKNGIIIFEGGSKERDNIEWMKKYNKEPIEPELHKNEIIQTQYDFLVLPPYPSITIMRKRI